MFIYYCILYCIQCHKYSALFLITVGGIFLIRNYIPTNLHIKVLLFFTASSQLNKYFNSNNSRRLDFLWFNEECTFFFWCRLICVNKVWKKKVPTQKHQNILVRRSAIECIGQWCVLCVCLKKQTNKKQSSVVSLICHYLAAMKSKSLSNV